MPKVKFALGPLPKPLNPLRYTKPLEVFLCGDMGGHETQRPSVVKTWVETWGELGVVRIATGGMHAVAITKDNKILTWGVNDNGALGRDTSQDETIENIPTAILDEYFRNGPTFVDVAAGDSCSFALTTEGALYGWGTFRGNEGVLKFTKIHDTAWTPILINKIKNVISIACGANHVVAIDKDYKVWTWGSGETGSLGRRFSPRGEGNLRPNPVAFFHPANKRANPRVRKVACGEHHSLALADDGHVWGWGANHFFQAGNHKSAGEDSVHAAQIIKGFGGLEVKDLAAGAYHSIAILKSGKVLIWGSCDTGIEDHILEAIYREGKLLKSGVRNILLEPTPIPGLEDIESGTCGTEHTIVLDKNGKAYSWGISTTFQTAQGTEGDIPVPTCIDVGKYTRFVWTGAGGQYSVLASDDATINSNVLKKKKTPRRILKP